jgi:hypothetical protein
MDDKTYEVRAKQGIEMEEKAGCRVVFPPCDTEALQGLGKLSERKRQLVSLAQFRYVCHFSLGTQLTCVARRKNMQNRSRLWRTFSRIIPNISQVISEYT